MIFASCVSAFSDSGLVVDFLRAISNLQEFEVGVLKITSLYRELARDRAICILINYTTLPFC
jgi:hypothetical protein